MDCNDSRRMNQAALEMTIFGDRAHPIALPVSSVDQDHCQRIKGVENIVRSYTRKCFKPFPKQVIGLLVYGNSKELKKRCDSAAAQAEYSKHAQCATGPTIEKLHQCMDNFIIDVESVRDTVTDLNLKMPYVCCQTHVFRRCIKRHLTNQGCPEDSINYVDLLVSGTVEDVIDLTCKGYEFGKGKCQTMPPLTKNGAKQSISYLPALVDIYTNL